MKTRPTPGKHSRSLEAGFTALIRHLQRCQRHSVHIDPEIYAAGRDLFTSDEALADWLSQPASALGGKVPILCARTQKGRRQVLQIIRAIEHGVCL